jgi:hypothetical protein
MLPVTATRKIVTIGGLFGLLFLAVWSRRK